MSREKFYEYVFTKDGEEASILVHAWSADGAENQAKLALQVRGIRANGRLLAKTPRAPVADGRTGPRRGDGRIR
jgi:hypothetical protein